MICAIVLAAGESRRMGAQKLLLPCGGKSVISHVVDRLLHRAVREVLVVVGHEGERIIQELSGCPVTMVRNPDYRAGMLSSVRCGVRALPAGCEAVLVALGDQPALTGDLVNDLIRSFPKAGKGILAPCFAGQRGHPVVIARRFFDEILTCHDAVGLRGLLQAHPEEVGELEVPTAAVLLDMDTPADYQREVARFKSPVK